MQRDRWRLSNAVLLSLVIHALLLSITFGGQTFGFPGLRLGCGMQGKMVEAVDEAARPLDYPAARNNEN